MEQLLMPFNAFYTVEKSAPMKIVNISVDYCFVTQIQVSTQSHTIQGNFYQQYWPMLYANISIQLSAYNNWSY